MPEEGERGHLSPPYRDVGYEVKDGVCTITISRKDGQGNALSQSLIAQLTDAFERASAAENGEGEGQVSVVLLKSAQKKFFCAGIDVREMQRDMHMPENMREEVNFRHSKALADLFEAIDHCPKTVIGVSEGIAVGGGATLLAATDCVIATKDAVFAYPEKAFNMLPWVSAPYLLRRVLEKNQDDGYSVARQYLNGVPVAEDKTEYQWSAEMSHEWGVVDQICSDNGLDITAGKAVSSALRRAQEGNTYKKSYSPPPPYEKPVSVTTAGDSNASASLLAESGFDSNEWSFMAEEPRDQMVEGMIQFVAKHLRGESGRDAESFKNRCAQNWCAQRCDEKKVRPKVDEYVRKLDEARKARREREGAAEPILPAAVDVTATVQRIVSP